VKVWGLEGRGKKGKPLKESELDKKVLLEASKQITEGNKEQARKNGKRQNQ